jgi:hypothetical protein
VEEEGAEVKIIFSNDPTAILSETDQILCANIHDRWLTKQQIYDIGEAKAIYTLEDIMREPHNGSGYNKQYGLLGSNKATETTIKLFPKNAFEVAYGIQEEYYNRTGIKIEAMVYGDGAFKDP